MRRKPRSSPGEANNLAAGSFLAYTVKSGISPVRT